MKQTICTLLICASLISLDAARAQAANDQDFYAVTSVEVNSYPISLSDDEIQTFTAEQSEQPQATLLPAGVSLGDLILVGEKVIQLIVANKPSVDVKRDVVGVLPEAVKDFAATQGWQMPVAQAVDMKLKNFMGISLAEAHVRVVANWGGSINGKGKFLRNVTIVPTFIRAFAGNKVNVWTEFREPVNMGTDKDPIAGLSFDIRYKATGAISESIKAVDVTVTGDGKISVTK